MPNQCQICGAADLRFLFNKKNRDFLACRSCGLIRQANIPEPQELKEFYDNAYANGMYADFAAARQLKIATAKQRLKEVRKQVPISGRWLDAGCSTGVFLKLLVEQGIEAFGIDVSEEAIRQASNENLPVECGDIASYQPRELFDCITAFDVIEHVREPKTFIEVARSLLREGGSLVLTTPNVCSPARYLMGKRWFFFIPEEHLFLFSRKNLRQLVSECGFGEIRQGVTFKPMTFDYALVQFEEFNPLIASAMKYSQFLIPKLLRTWGVPLPIGEQRLVATRQHC